MPLLGTLYRQYSTTVNFRFVYILEAHASDEWPIRSSRDTPSCSPVCIAQTKSIPDRLAAAKQFFDDFRLPYPMAIDDPISNAFEVEYAPWPVRIYVVDSKNVLVYKAQPSEDMLELKPLQALLEHLSKEKFHSG